MSSTIDMDALGQLGLMRAGPEKPRDRLGQAEFMRLMITQLRNQDPFSPMESGEFLGQLAQFGTVSGIEDIRRAFEGLAGAITANQTLQAAGLVNRQVLVPAREAWLPPEGGFEGAVDLPPGATDLSIGVYDLNGRLVAALPVPADDGQRAAFSWDGALPGGGRAAPGFYELRATATHGGRNLALEVLVSGRVESVSVGDRDGALALTVTGLGAVEFHRVRGIA